VPSVNPIQGTTIVDNVASEQASSGVVQYRCIYVTNDSPSNNVYGTNLYISEDVALGADIDLGFKIANERQIVKVVNFSTVTGGYLDVTYTRDTSYPFTVAYDSAATTFADNFKLAINAIDGLEDVMVIGSYDAGFDILTPASEILSKPLANKVDFKIVCACKMVTQSNIYNTGFYMYPRSSISKSPLRLANNVGIIDAGYRGHLIGMFDLPAGSTEHIAKFDKYLQICAPGLVPIVVELVDSKEDLGEATLRGEGGFGSTSTSTF
jgi:dUTP pyrophosphatase